MRKIQTPPSLTKFFTSKAPRLALMHFFFPGSGDLPKSDYLTRRNEMVCLMFGDYIIDVSFIGTASNPARFSFTLVTCIANPCHRYSAEHDLPFLACDDEKTAIAELERFVVHAEPIATEIGDEFIIDVPATQIAAAFKIVLVCAAAALLQKELQDLQEWHSTVDDELHEARMLIADLQQQKSSDELAQMTIALAAANDTRDRLAARVREMAAELRQYDLQCAIDQRVVDLTRRLDAVDMDRFKAQQELIAARAAAQSRAEVLHAIFPASGARYAAIVHAADRHHAVLVISMHNHAVMQRFSISTSAVAEVFDWQAAAAADAINAIVFMIDDRVHVVGGEILEAENASQSRLILMLDDGWEGGLVVEPTQRAVQFSRAPPRVLYRA